ncbi:MAG: GTPase [Dethiobacteria bacterium]|nr:50S ribosome-binding GTPase [Bacillota bacterium]NMD33931.1 TGS domain-containing protein [Bacillota bacterium]HOB28940.1 50S ribosome-binding GTPase [Bacillota bacterium]HPZ41504.1 50S ribosome-binding GTPase [Bacillota bacterium]HQD52456.1 50S ribosome-binding GTPase [Bacillota bacterium]
MPANLTPQYHAAEDRYRDAKTAEEKETALQEMLALIPKHKGTEKLQADIKKRLARLKEEGKKKKPAKGYDPFAVEKEGAGQIVLAGYPNSGKSALVGALTRARVKVTDYPYATPLPVSGMMPYEDTHIQLVDTPPVTLEAIPPGLIGTFKAADALLIVVDAASPDCLEQLEGMLQLLQEREVIDLSEEGEIIAPLPFIIAATKIDLPKSEENLQVLRELRPDLTFDAISCHGPGLDQLRRKLFEILGVIRIYGKAPGRPPDKGRPFILRKGSTVLDFAELVHKDFPKNLKSALVWGSSRFDGQAVARDYILEDQDVVELQL